MARPVALHFPQHLQSQINNYVPGQHNVREDSRRKPFVTLTYAASLDSQIAIAPNTQTIISGPETKAMTHYLRYKHDGIAIGSGTLEADNPSLNCRFNEALEEGISSQPTPLILDQKGTSNIHSGLKVFQISSEGYGKRPIVCLGTDAMREWRKDGRLMSAQSCGATLIATDSFHDTLKSLSDLNITSLMIEGGANVINNIISNHLDLIDTVIITIAPTYFGQGGVAVSPTRTDMADPITRFKDVTWIPMGNDVVMCANVSK